MVSWCSMVYPPAFMEPQITCFSGIQCSWLTVLGKLLTKCPSHVMRIKCMYVITNYCSCSHKNQQLELFTFKLNFDFLHFKCIIVFVLALLSNKKFGKGQALASGMITLRSTSANKEARSVGGAVYVAEPACLWDSCSCLWDFCLCNSWGTK